MRRLIYAILPILCILSGCGGDEIEIIDPVDPDADPYVLSLSGTALRLEREGGSATVSLTSDKSWTASVSDEWLTVSPLSGNEGITDITVSAPADDSVSRVATVTFTADGKSVGLTVAQKGVTGEIIISGDTEASEDNVTNTIFDRIVTVIFSTDGNAEVIGLASGISASVKGNGVTITNIGEERVIYELSGTASDGFFKVYSGKKQAIILNGVSITNKKGAAINNQGKKRCFVVVRGSNALADGGTYTSTSYSEDEKAAFFSEGQLIFSGEGSLEVTATGKAGITSDDYVRVMSSPSITVTSSAGHGIRGKQAVIVSNGAIDVTATADMKKGFSSDSLVQFTGGTTTIKVTGNAAYDSEERDYNGSAGIKADQQFLMSGGTVSITNSGTGGKGISVGSSERIQLPASVISGGELTVSATGANYTKGDISSKGIKIGWAVKSGNRYTSFSGDLRVTGGKVSVSSANSEAIEVKREVEISGGEVYAFSHAEDAINSASTFTITGGYVCGISYGNDGLDANGNFYIKGGVVYAVGKNDPEMAIDANTEGGFKLYVEGGTLFTIGGLERGASLTQSCYYASSWSKDTWYSMTVGEKTYAFKTPSSGGTNLIVSGSSKPVLKSGATPSGGTERFNGMMLDGCSSGDGKEVSLSAYSGGSSGPGPGPGWH